MANETTFSLISSWIPDIVQATEEYLFRNCVMPSLVTVFDDDKSMRVRRADKYVKGSVGTLTEGTKITSFTAVTRSPFGTVTPKEIGDGFIITDDRINSDPFNNILDDLVAWSTQLVQESVETDLLGGFSSFTAGTVGTAGSVITWNQIVSAEAMLYAAGALAPFNVVLQPYAMAKLAQAQANAVPIVYQTDLLAANSNYVGSVGGLNLYRAPLIAAGTSVTQGVFSRKAVAYDIRRPIRLEAIRSPEYRGYTIVLSHEYAAGAWRADMGVKLISDASVPS